MHAKKKVTIIIDSAVVKQIGAMVMNAGAKGYTIIPGVSGEGHRGIRRGHDIFEPAQNSLVVVICDDATARRIVDAAMEMLQRNAGIVYTEDVEVARGALF